MALFTSKYLFFLIEVKDEEEDQCWIYDGKKLSDKAGLWAPIEVTIVTKGHLISKANFLVLI